MIYTKLIKALDEMPPIIKDSTNPMFRSQYASLPAVANTVLPILRKHGIIMSNKLINEPCGLEINLIDVEDNDKLTNIMPLLNTENMQKLGGSITYATRYGLLMMLGLCADDDDDGNSISQNYKNKSIPNIKIVAPNKSIKSFWDELSEDEKRKLKESDTEKYYTVESSVNETLSADIVDRRIKWIKNVLEENKCVED